MIPVSLCARLHLGVSSNRAFSLPQSYCLNPERSPTALPPRRSPLVLRLFALALADGSGLPFSLHPPPAALESQTPQREPRRRFAPQAHTAAAPRNSIPLSTPLTAKNRITKPKSSTHRMLLFVVYIIRSIIIKSKLRRFQSIISERKLSPSVSEPVMPNISSMVFDSSA